MPFQPHIRMHFLLLGDGRKRRNKCTYSTVVSSALEIIYNPNAFKSRKPRRTSIRPYPQSGFECETESNDNSARMC